MASDFNLSDGRFTLRAAERCSENLPRRVSGIISMIAKYDKYERFCGIPLDAATLLTGRGAIPLLVGLALCHKPPRMTKRQT